jgi:hypothetical protein
VKALAGATRFEEAERLARTVRMTHFRDTAYLELVDALAHADQVERAVRTIELIDDHDLRLSAQTMIARALVESGDGQRASHVAADVHAAAIDRAQRPRSRSVSRLNPERRLVAIVGVAEVYALTGLGDRAQAILAEAEGAARAIEDRTGRRNALTALARGFAVAGEIEKAAALADEAEAESPSIVPTPLRPSPLFEAARFLERIGRSADARRLVAVGCERGRWVAGLDIAFRLDASVADAVADLFRSSP